MRRASGVVVRQVFILGLLWSASGCANEEIGPCAELEASCATMEASARTTCIARVQTLRASANAATLCRVDLRANTPVVLPSNADACSQLLDCCSALATLEARDTCSARLIASEGSMVATAICEAAHREYNNARLCHVQQGAPLGEECDQSDPTLCLLPFPSDFYTRADSATRTGRRINLNLRSFNSADDVSRANLADGFSRASPVVAGLSGILDVASLGLESAPETATLRLYVADSASAENGRAVALRYGSFADAVRGQSVAVGYPQRNLGARTKHVVVLLDSARQTNGAPFRQDRIVRVALGLESAQGANETALFDRYQDIRAFLTSKGIASEHVLRAWSFTTRSTEDAQGILMAMREEGLRRVVDNRITVQIDSVEHRATGAVHSIVLGRLLGVPDYRNNIQDIALSAANLPMNPTDGVMPFRLMIPRASATCSDYRMTIYGHGAGGNHTDDDFDEEFAGLCFGKLSVSYYGWTNACPLGLPAERCRTVPDVAAGLANLLQGAHRAAGGLLDAINQVFIMNRVLPTLMDTVASGTTLPQFSATGMRIGDEPNPHAGRHLDFSTHFYLGGSLGGTMGLIIGKADDQINRGVLNVPGAGWSHWVTESFLYTLFSGTIIAQNGNSILAIPALLSAGQILFDPIDGLTYEGLPGDDVFLVQESLGDEVMPNNATTNVVRTVNAVQIGTVLRDVLGVEHATTARGRSGYTQYAVTAGIYQKHGFAIQNNAAGHAAFEQMRTYADAAWGNGITEIVVPASCPNGRCDFR